MKKILFVCYGNICRSPMAEFIMKDLACKHRLDKKLYIESAATSSIEVGHPVYDNAKELLAMHGIDCNLKRARCISKDDYNNFDMIIGMDDNNVADMKLIFGGDPDNKIRLLLDFSDTPGIINDPYFTRDFTKAFSDIERGCTGLLNFLLTTET